MFTPLSDKALDALEEDALEHDYNDYSSNQILTLITMIRDLQERPDNTQDPSQ